MNIPLLLVSLGLFLGGCFRSSPPVVPVKKETRPAAVVGYHQVMESETITGKRLAAANRPTAMIVFASWCKPCRRELAALSVLRKTYPSLRVIGLNAYEDYGNFSDQQRLERYLGQYAPWLHEVVHADAKLLNAFGRVPKIPSLFVYDAEGQIVAEFRRNKAPPPSESELEAAVAQAVKGALPTASQLHAE